jgi:hypothetical protein
LFVEGAAWTLLNEAVGLGRVAPSLQDEIFLTMRALPDRIQNCQER